MSLLRFKKDELVTILSKFMGAMKKHKDSYTRAVLIEPQQEGPCLFWINAPDNRFFAEIPVHNDGGRIDRNLVLELRPFYELIRGHDGEFVSIQEDGRKFKLCTHSGVVDLENFSRMASRIKEEDSWRKRAYEETKCNTEEFLWFLAVAEKAMVFSMISSHKRACIQDGIAYMNFGNVVVTVSGFGIKSIGIRSVDFKFIRKALEGTEEFLYQFRGKVYMLSSKGMKFTIPTIDYRDLYYVRESVNRFDVKSSIEIPLKSLYDIIMYISKVTGGADIVAIECRSGRLFVEASTKIGRNLSFPIVENIRESFAVRMSVDLVKKALLIVNFASSEENAGLRLVTGTDGRIVFESGRVKVTAGAYC